ncbi:LysR family transcriptional regulator [Psychromonas sp. MME2]|uniref:LysR family transcriptional regulator n=1 Tax=unclassified Psychromonas TaxID=2614957 RepID=UPI00339C01EA
MAILNPNWLNTFVTLIDTGHFTKSAEKLFMTQPGVSQHINKLEDACGHPLIRRDKKSFELTEQGRLVYEYARQLANNEHQLLEKLAFDDPFSGRVTIACSGALALILYPLLLDLQTLHPQLVIQLKAAPNQQILNEIQKGLIDIGIVTHIPNHSLFDVQELGCEQLCLVFPASVESDCIDVNLLTSLGLINHPDAEHYLSLYVAKSQDSHFNTLNISALPVSGYINQISQILQPVARGLGFTVLPKSAIDSFQDPQHLKIFASQKPVMEDLYLVKKRNRLLPARFKTVNAKLQAHFHSLL